MLFTRTRVLLFFALVVPMAAVSLIPAQAPKGSTVVTSSVFSRSKGKTSWSLHGIYKDEKEGRAVYDHLVRTGFQVELRLSNVPIPKIAPRPITGKLPLGETVVYKDAVDVFKWMARQKDIAYRYPIDGCYARAELMIERMQKNKWRPRKIWSVANGERLYARTKNRPKGYVEWGYHVAPVLRVRDTKGNQQWYVIDPSLSNAPMTVTAWEKAQMRTARSPKPYLTISNLGHGPVWVDQKRKPGTGYWPASDPKEGKHAHAVAKMKRYKPWEGKEPPAGFVGLPVFPRLDLARLEHDLMMFDAATWDSAL